MNVRVLSREEALAHGANLWILPSLTFSEWTRQLDWPLNLQITRSVHHSRPEFPPPLKKILTENDLGFQIPKISENPGLLIASADLLPNRLTLVLHEDSWETWRDAGLGYWRSLGEPSLRLFLPTFAKWEQVKDSWPKKNAPETLEVVESTKETESRVSQ